MKNSILIFAVLVALAFAACGGNSNSPKEETAGKNDTIAQSNPTANDRNTNSATNDIVAGYLNLKNALTDDNGNEAASAAKQISVALSRVDESVLKPGEKKVYDDVKDDIKEHAEHIASNGANIAHQREHFDLLSADVIDLVKATGSSQALYKDFCPMYKKGASWLSETKEIKNPYFGKEMPKCGVVKEEIKPRG